MRVVFLGSADFGIPALSMLLQKHEVAGIVSTPPRQKGRGLKMCDSPIVEFARHASGAPILMPQFFKNDDLIRELDAFYADCFIVVAFKILPSCIFSLPRLGTLNIHASLLPAYRGPAPIQRAIEAGETKTGVTIFRIDEGIDTGEIVLQQEVPIGEEECTPELYEKLSKTGADLLCTALENLQNGNSSLIPQSTLQGSSAPKLKKAEACIDWKQPAHQIFNKIRAFKPFPGTFTLFQGKRLEIEWAQPVISTGERAECGTVCHIGNDYFDVQTGNDMLRILTVKPEGRKSMPVRDYLHGTDLREGCRFHE